MFIFANEKPRLDKQVMANTEYITIKNASRKVLNRMRQIGIDKAQRLEEIQKRWDAGEYKNSEIVQLWIMEDYVRIFRSSTGDVYHIRWVLIISFELLIGYFRADLASSPPKRSELRFKGLEAKMPKRNKSKQR